MEYQQIANLIDHDASKEPSKFRIRNWVEINDCASFTNCRSEINNTQVDNAKDIDVIVLLYNLLEYSLAYAKTSSSLWQYCKDSR